MERILVFIPVYNCQKQIKRVLSKFDTSMQGIFSEILIVDNRSTDETLKSCQQAMEHLPDFKVTLVQNAKNYNLGGSHKVAFQYAIAHKYDYVVVLHGDDQGDIRDMVYQIRNGVHRETDCLLGARFMKQSQLINYSWLRTFGNICFNMLFSLVCRRKLYDLGSGLNGYKVSFLTNGFYLRFPNALTFNYYMILYTVAIGATFRFFPLTWREDDQISNVKLFKQTRQLFKVLATYCFSSRVFMQGQHEGEREYLFHEIGRSNPEIN